MPSSLQRIVSDARARAYSQRNPPIRGKRALLIGINYVGTPYELQGSIRDAETMESYYRSIGVSDIRVLTDFTELKPTRDGILESFRWLKEVDGDLFLHFSGHGNLEHRKVDPTDCLISTLTTRIRDDEIRSMFESLPSSTSLFCCFDVCHNGSGMDLRYQLTAESKTQLRTLEDTRYSPTSARIVFFSGCGDQETCVESVEDGTVQGAMTWALRKVLAETTVLRELLIRTTELLKQEGYTQTPQISLGKLIDLNEKAF